MRWIMIFGAIGVVVPTIKPMDSVVVKPTKDPIKALGEGVVHQKFIEQYPTIKSHVSRDQLAETRKRLADLKIMLGGEIHELIARALAVATREEMDAVGSSESSRSPERFWLPVEVESIANTPLALSLLQIECEQLKRYMETGNRQLGLYHDLLIQLLSSSRSKKSCCYCSPWC